MPQPLPNPGRERQSAQGASGGEAMILRRIADNLRSQNWTAIAIEFAIVVIGVFLGTQVANWNQERSDRLETERMLVQLRPEIQSQVEFFANGRTYYATTRRYADHPLAAWAGDKRISDEQFVIAAYQASQIFGIGINAENWALTFGGEQLRNIDDPQLRRNLQLVLTQDYSPVSSEAVATPYREQVRRVIPIGIQDRIRSKCGDRPIREAAFSILPPTCQIKLDPAEAKKIAATLRARPDLAQELSWHLAAIAAYMASAEFLEQPISELQRDLAKLSRASGRTAQNARPAS